LDILPVRMPYALFALVILVTACQPTAVPATNGLTSPLATPAAASPLPASSPSLPSAIQTLNIAVFGDSIAAGTNVGEADRWQTRLQAALATRDPSGVYSVHNFAQANSRIDYTEQQVASFDPKPYRVAILVIGRDDAGFVFPDADLVATYRSRLGGIIRALLAKGLAVLIANPPPDLVDGKLIATPVGDFIRKVAGDRLVDLENVFLPQPNPASLYTDRVQPNAAGQALMSDTFLSALTNGGYLK
jgi:lysophospholipase L1-like esterase